MRNRDELTIRFMVFTVFFACVVLIVANMIRDRLDAQAVTAAKSAFLEGDVPVETPSLPGGGLFAPVQLEYLSVGCGAGEIRISFETGEAEFINCNPSDASKSLWTGLKPFFKDCRR